MNDRERFMRYVAQSPGCWHWTGACSTHGYGRFRFRSKPCYAHRVALTVLAGIEIPAGLLVMHSCDNPSCVNPAHLSVGTQTDNMRDASAKGRTVRVQDWRGTLNPKAKLTPEQQAEIRRRLEAGERPVVLAPEFGVSRTRISQLRTKKAGGGWAVEEF